ncbi:hypothetical protein M601_004865 [Cellulophaga baltica 4]|nr:hypothetical protein M601_004865 [Cellulophaga baltica 4]
MAHLQLEYNADIIHVIPVVFTKESEFYVTNDAIANKSLFIEVDNRQGKKGYLLKTTNYTNTEDKWVAPFCHNGSDTYRYRNFHGFSSFWMDCGKRTHVYCRDWSCFCIDLCDANTDPNSQGNLQSY